MENPWKVLPERPPYVLPSDEQAVAAFNAAATEEHKNHVELPPEPFLGRADAPVVLLNLNPGFHERDYLTYEDPYALDIWRRNILHEPLDFPFFLLDPRIEGATGAGWWRKKLKEPIGVAGVKAVANTISCIEYFPYHSRKFRAMGRPLESQLYSFLLVNQAIDRNATIILMRSRRLWEYAGPRLKTYPNRFALNNVAISRNNCPDGFPAIEGALRRTSPG